MLVQHHEAPDKPGQEGRAALFLASERWRLEDSKFRVTLGDSQSKIYETMSYYHLSATTKNEERLHCENIST